MLEPDYQGLMTLLSACAGPSLSLTELSSEDLEEETEHQELKINVNPLNHMQSLITTHQDVTCTSFSPPCSSPLSLLRLNIRS